MLNSPFPTTPTRGIARHGRSRKHESAIGREKAEQARQIALLVAIDKRGAVLGQVGDKR